MNELGRGHFGVGDHLWIVAYTEETQRHALETRCTLSLEDRDQGTCVGEEEAFAPVEVQEVGVPVSEADAEASAFRLISGGPPV